MQCHAQADLETMLSHLMKGMGNSFIWRLHNVQLRSDTGLIVRTNEKIPISKLFYCYCSLCPDYCVYTANCKHATQNYIIQCMLVIKQARCTSGNNRQYSTATAHTHTQLFRPLSKTTWVTWYQRKSSHSHIHIHEE